MLIWYSVAVSKHMDIEVGRCGKSDPMRDISAILTMQGMSKIVFIQVCPPLIVPRF